MQSTGSLGRGYEARLTVNQILRGSVCPGIAGSAGRILSSPNGPGNGKFSLQVEIGAGSVPVCLLPEAISSLRVFAHDLLSFIARQT